MKHTLTFAALAAAAFVSPSFAQEQAATADQVLALVRYSQALQNHDLVGEVRNDKTGATSPFALTLRNSVIRFTFANPNQVIQLQINDNGGTLSEVTGGSTKAVALARHGELVRATDINYEDLAMRFLWWPKPQMLEEETVRTRKCWQVLVYSPDVKGPYRAVKVWVDKESGAMMKLQCYDNEGKMVKRFSVISGQKIDDAWVLKEMRVEAYEPGASSPYGRTYLKIDKTTRG